jgi:hypothetical protein
MTIPIEKARFPLRQHDRADLIVMAWAVALVVVIGVGMPVAAWWIVRRLPPPRTPGRLGVGYDAIDRWLLDHYQLPPLERWRVRKAVFQGRQVKDRALELAANGLATQVLSGRFRLLRVSQVLGWADIVLAIGCAAAGIVSLATSHQTDEFVLAILFIVNAGLFTFAGVIRALRAPKQIRHNAAQALRLNRGMQ